jgi:hypothetical protein
MSATNIPVARAAVAKGRSAEVTFGCEPAGYAILAYVPVGGATDIRGRGVDLDR